MALNITLLIELIITYQSRFLSMLYQVYNIFLYLAIRLGILKSFVYKL